MMSYFKNLFSYNPEDSVFNVKFDDPEINNNVSLNGYNSLKGIDLAGQLRSKIEAHNELQKVLNENQDLFK